MAAAAVVASFIAAVSYLYGLDKIFGYGDEAFPPLSPMDWLNVSRVDFGADFIIHAIPMGFVAFGMAMLIPALAQRTTATFFGTFFLSVAWHIVGFNWYLEPHGVLADPVDDVLIITSLILTMLHIGLAIFVRGVARVRSIVCALAMGAVILETIIVHATIIMPSAQIYDATGEWLKKAISEDGDYRNICRRNGLTCLVQNGKTFDVEPGTRNEGVPIVVAERAIEAVKKYGIADMPAPQHPRVWTFRHRSFNNYTGSLRMPAVEFMDDGARKVVVDTTFAPVANLWIRAFTHLHFLPLSVVWSILLVLINAIHARRKRTQ